ncbi:uncharacterized protein LOC111251217 isoform X3 [Varroa destructor]|uniref:PIN domain-containing protein n=1 Tax=Varroa destructor TaxID=109461 RepID=A0A7M7KGQ2_VARDE|nr:uncharacterized protein LOC111251217 isoform X3 [Varroa destructor]
MDRLTPAQQAVLERIERKKELEAKKLLKRKGKKAPTTATSVKPDEKPSQQGQGDAEISAVESKKSAQIEEDQKLKVYSLSDDTEEANDDRKKRNVSSATGDVSDLKTPQSRSRRTDVLSGKSEATEAPLISGEAAVATKGNRGRKTMSALENPISEESAMTPAQLEVLEKLKKKQSDNPKGKKSVKSATVTEPEMETDSDTSLSLTVVEPVVKSRRKTTQADVSIQEHPMTSTMIETSVRGRRKTLNADLSIVVPLSTKSEPEKASKKKTLPKIIDLDESDGDLEPDEPMNMTQLAVMELIKKKKEAEEAKSSKGRKSRATDVSNMEEPLEESAPGENNKQVEDISKKAAKAQRQSLTPNQIAVMKRLQRKHDQTIKIASSDDNCESDASSCSAPRFTDTAVASTEQDVEFQRTKEFLDILKEGSRRASYRLVLKELVLAGVTEAVQKLKPLSDVQKDLVATCRQQILGDECLQSSGSSDVVQKKFARKRRVDEDQPSNAKVKRKLGDSSKSKTSSRGIEEDDEVDTDATEDIVTQKKRPKKVPKPQSPEITSDDNDHMECDMLSRKKETKTTFIIFDTNAFLHIYPYCKAVLECDKVEADEDFESITMFAIFVVVRELDGLSKKNSFIRQTAVNAIRLIHGALQDNNPRIEGQDFSASQKRLDGSTLNDDYILKSAEIVSKRGDSVVVVTDDTNLHVKVAMMRLQALSLIDFIARFHWLTPIVTANLVTDMKLIGEEAIALFAETVVTSIVLKAVMAQLSPMPMEERRELFPSKKLAITLAYTLKYKRLLEERGEPFASLNYDRVATTLNALQKYREVDSKNPDRMKHYARFLSSAVTLLRNIAAFFPNMQTRVDLVASLSNAYQHHLPTNERVQHQAPEPQQRRSRLDPATLSKPYLQRTIPPVRKTLLPTPPSVNVMEPPVALESIAVSGTQMNATTVAMPVHKSRQIRQNQGNKNEEFDVGNRPDEPVYFSFSEGQRTAEPSQAPAQPLHAALASPARYSFTASSPPARQQHVPSTHVAPSTGPITPLGRTGATSGRQASPYAACQELISTDVIKTVYNYFQQFGTSVCNYTGSCCVKMGVRFTLAFTASGAQLEASLHEVTESFGRVLQAMKKLITDATVENARLFLQYSAEVMRLICKADPNLVTPLPDISPNGLLQFVTDSGASHCNIAIITQPLSFSARKVRKRTISYFEKTSQRGVELSLFFKLR